MNTFRDYLLKKDYIKEKSKETCYVENIKKRVAVIQSNPFLVEPKYNAFSSNQTIKKKIKLKIDRVSLISLNSRLKSTEDINGKELIIEFLINELIYKVLLNEHKSYKRVIYSNFRYKWSIYENETDCVIEFNQMVINDNNKTLGFIDKKAIALKVLSKVTNEFSYTITNNDIKKKLELFNRLLKEYQLEKLNEDYLTYENEDFKLLKNQLDNLPYISLLSSKLNLLNQIKKDNEYEKENFLTKLTKKKEIKKYKEEELVNRLKDWDNLTTNKSILLLIEELKMKCLLLNKTKNNIFGLYFFFCTLQSVQKIINYKQENKEDDLEKEYESLLQEFLKEEIEKVNEELNFLLDLENDNLLERDTEMMLEELKEKRINKLIKVFNK